MVPDRDTPLMALAKSRVGPAVASSAATKLAVVRSDNSRGSVAEALALLDSDLRPNLCGTVAILARIGRRRADSADPSALSALIDVVLAGGSSGAVVLSGHPSARERFDRLGFLRECWGRPVRFAALPGDEDRWDRVEVPGLGAIRISGTVARAGCRVALTPIAALRGRSIRTADRLPGLDAVHPADRPRFEDRPVPLAGPVLSVVAGPIGRFGHEVVAIAGFDPMAVDVAAASVLGRPADGIRSRYEIVGDAAGPLLPRGASSDRSSRGPRRDTGHRVRWGGP